MKKLIFILVVIIIIVLWLRKKPTPKPDANFEWDDLDKEIPFVEFYGYGANVIIENPKEIEVTNLNNSGTGSLRDALNQSGHRKIIVKVSGTINLTNNIYVTNGNFILRGNGIKLSGGMVQLEASNIIISDVAITKPPSGYDCISVTAWQGKHIENIVLDHLDLSEAADENLNLRGAGSIKNVTVQNCKVSDGIYGMLIVGDVSNVTVFNNYFTNNTERNIRLNSLSENALSFELVNNVFEDFRSGTRVSLGSRFSILYNTYLPREGASSTIIKGLNDEVSEGQEHTTHAYILGNDIPEGFNLSGDRLQPYLKDKPFVPLTVMPRTTYKESVMANAGTKK